MKIFKIVSNLLLLSAAIFLGYSYISKKGIFSKLSSQSTETGVVVGTDEVVKASFTGLVNQDGVVVNSKDLLGKHMLVIFGFSSCKRICPAELGMASQLLNRLDESIDTDNKLKVVFISVDPKHDTVETLKEYHKAFDSRIIMLTGSESDIGAAVSNYKVYVGQFESEEGETVMDHSSFMYLIDGNGRYVGHFSPNFDDTESQSDELFAFISKHILNA